MEYVKKNHKLTCVICGKDYFGRQSYQKTCSSECRNKRVAAITGRHSTGSISTGTVGAISEMGVAIFLMNEGYSVFRALSPACQCDLIALKDDKSIRIEVRTGYEDEKGKISFPSRTNDSGRQDVYAIFVRSKNKVRFFNSYDKKEIFEI